MSANYLGRCLTIKLFGAHASVPLSLRRQVRVGAPSSRYHYINRHSYYCKGKDETDDAKMLLCSPWAAPGGGQGPAAPRALVLPPQLPPHLWLNEFVVPHDEMN